MKAKSLLSLLFIFLVITFVLIAVISVYLALSLLIERYSHGAGLLFADVEIFGLVTILFNVLSVITILAYKKILRLKKYDK
ncbi:MAG: hypothetical protein HXY48_06950 [Ignavibacteriaceae bacterium]|nr:hypothetical protein [Ignavibacteriaceae bacterium]